MAFFGKRIGKRSNAVGAGVSERMEREELSPDALRDVSGGFEFWSADGCITSAEPCNDGGLRRLGESAVGSFLREQTQLPAGGGSAIHKKGAPR